MAYQSISGEVDRISVVPHTGKDGTQTVVVDGYANKYPLATLHLSREEAYKLAADLTAAADSLTNQAVAA